MGTVFQAKEDNEEETAVLAVLTDVTSDQWNYVKRNRKKSQVEKSDFYFFLHLIEVQYHL